MLVGRGGNNLHLRCLGNLKNTGNHIINKQTERGKIKRQTLVVVIDPGNEMSDYFAWSYLIIQSKFFSPFTFLACPLQRFCKLLNKARRKQFGNLFFFLLFGWWILIWFSLFSLVWGFLQGGQRGFLFVSKVFNAPVLVNSVPTCWGYCSWHNEGGKCC